VVKLSETGELLWENSFGGTAFDAAESISPARDGGFLISGTSRSMAADMQNAGENDLIALKIDTSGNLLWQYTFGGSGVDLGFDLIESSDGGLLLTGELGPPGNPELNALGMTDLILMKIR
jgi:outer membrane protein assembly factor BamB